MIINLIRLIKVKLLWAPIVDSVYFHKLGCFHFGRRKSWLVPVQLVIGVLMLSTGNLCQNLIYNASSKSDIIILTSIFIVFNTLAATQGNIKLKNFLKIYLNQLILLDIAVGNKNKILNK